MEKNNFNKENHLTIKDGDCSDKAESDAAPSAGATWTYDVTSIAVIGLEASTVLYMLMLSENQDMNLAADN